MLYIVSFVFYKFMGGCAKYELVLFPPFHQSKREVELKQSDIFAAVVFVDAKN